MEVVDAHMHLWTPETHKWVAQVKDGGHPAGPFGENRLSHLLALVRLYRVGGGWGGSFWGWYSGEEVQCYQAAVFDTS